MHLWNDYEGKTLAGRHTLGTLLRPEGRSALFALAGNSQQPAIIRITESINDEGQMLATWRRLSELKQENILAITDFGEATFEGTPLTYAVLEPTDASLADLLSDRAMTQAEALQLATSMAAALSALHAANFVHEHVDPANIFAVGETVKLRADCVRECIVDNEFVTADDRARLVQQDTHDFGAVLLRALTLEKKLRPGMNLPGPFDKVIPRAIEGTWSMAEISKVLMPAVPRVAPAPKVPVAAPASIPPAAVGSAPEQVSAVPAAAASIAPAPSKVPGATTQPTAITNSTASTSPAAVAAALDSTPSPQATLPYPEPAGVAGDSGTPAPHTVVADNPLLFQRRIQVPTAPSTSRLPKWAPLAIAAAVLVALVLYLLHGSSPAPTPQASVVRTPSMESHQTVAHSGPAQPAAAAKQVAEAAPVSRPEAAAKRVEPGWYVIAYTFNHEEQALQRAAAIVRRYPGLRPQVIAPTGNAYMVALGGAMSRNEAQATLSHARRAGLPRDTFVRNYGS